MKPTNLNPCGNAFERFQSCWFMFWHPELFIEGILNAFTERVLAYNAVLTAGLGVTIPTEDDEATQADHTETVLPPIHDLELSVAAVVARNEAANGK